MKALTQENILAAFRKMGIVPLDRDVITEQMMAPSTTSSTRGSLPIPQASPVRVMEDLIHRHLARQATSSNNQGIGTAPLSGPSSTVTPGTTLTCIAINDLASTSASFLVSTSPPQSTSTLPAYKPHTISPFKSRHAKPLDRMPLIAHEQELHDVLFDAEQRDTIQKNMMVGMQATVLLQGMYVTRTQQHLQEQEERRKKKSRKRIFGDGMPKLLDSDEFFA